VSLLTGIRSRFNHSSRVAALGTASLGRRPLGTSRSWSPTFWTEDMLRPGTARTYRRLPDPGRAGAAGVTAPRAVPTTSR
jgi:hypothetical protein